MSIEAALIALFNPLNGNRIWWDDLPDAYVVTDPVILLSQAGGDSRWYVDNTRPDKEHARIRFTVWAKSRMAANATARMIEAKLADAADENLAVQPYGNFITVKDEDMGYYGTHQDFGLWYPRP